MGSVKHQEACRNSVVSKRAGEGKREHGEALKAPAAMISKTDFFLQAEGLWSSEAYIAFIYVLEQTSSNTFLLI